jgi:isochorismate synthase
MIENPGIKSNEAKPFVAYKLPGAKSISILSGIIRTLDQEDFHKHQGFIFSPFIVSDSNPVLFLDPDYVSNNLAEIPSSFIERMQNIHSESENDFIAPAEKSAYLQKLEKLIMELNSGSAEKVVISRTIVTDQISDKQIFQLYNKLCQTYPSAFVYLAHFPPYGTWLGATPETLISCEGKKCRTMALAGTRKAGSQGKWGSKETEEQAIVSRYIHDALLKYQVQDIQITEPFTRQAGAMEHLCTDFSFEISGTEKMAQIIDELHPTPAVCGIPKEKALQLIKQYENHDREYYTGFLGPSNMNGKTDLFVNLRCMKITLTNLILFTGGGITKDSVPEKEWEETEMKAQTLLSVLEKIRNLAP